MLNPCQFQRGHRNYCSHIRNRYSKPMCELTDNLHISEKHWIEENWHSHHLVEQ